MTLSFSPAHKCPERVCLPLRTFESSGSVLTGFHRLIICKNTLFCTVSTTLFSNSCLLRIVHLFHLGDATHWLHIPLLLLPRQSTQFFLPSMRMKRDSTMSTCKSKTP